MSFKFHKDFSAKPLDLDSWLGLTTFKHQTEKDERGRFSDFTI